jgi:enoyl-CoA hydratase/carnithine racemase
MTERQFIKASIEDRLALLTLDHPPANAFSQVVLAELDAAIDEVLANPEVKVVILTGAGPMVFSAGADINDFTKLESSEQALAFVRLGHTVCAKIEASPKPFIAAMNGLALGGGLELALACHLRIIGDRAKVGQPEINLGIIPGWGGTQRLPRFVGKAKALEMMLTGDQITAQEAFRLNLVNKVVPGGEVLKTAKDLGRKIAAKGGVAIRAILDAARLGSSTTLAEGLDHEAEQFARVVASEDAREGVSAFLQKRQPAFKDK